MAPNAPTGGASLSDILTPIKNIVTALATEAQNYLNVQGAVNAAGITAPTIVSSKAGRIASVSVIVAGSGAGSIYDAVSLSDTTKPIYIIPTAVADEPYVVNMPISFGIVVVPGGSQTVTVSYS